MAIEYSNREVLDRIIASEDSLKVIEALKIATRAPLLLRQGGQLGRGRLGLRRGYQLPGLRQRRSEGAQRHQASRESTQTQRQDVYSMLRRAHKALLIFGDMKSSTASGTGAGTMNTTA
jgi:hypothetical protein